MVQVASALGDQTEATKRDTLGKPGRPRDDGLLVPGAGFHRRRFAWDTPPQVSFDTEEDAIAAPNGAGRIAGRR
jgi:hypothetical protein